MNYFQYCLWIQYGVYVWAQLDFRYQPNVKYPSVDPNTIAKNSQALYVITISIKMNPINCCNEYRHA